MRRADSGRRRSRSPKMEVGSAEGSSVQGEEDRGDQMT
jgi:hypothetical protein